MKKPLRTLFLAVVAILLGGALLGAPRIALADTSTELQGKLASARAQLDELYGQAEQISEQLNGTKVQLDETTGLVEQAEASIAQTERQIAEKQAELAERQQSLAAMARVDYKNGSVSVLSVLLNANSFEDLWERVYYADKVSEQRAGQIAATKQLKAELNDKNIELTGQKQQLETQRAHQESLLAEQEAQQASLDAQVAEAESYVNGLDQEVQQKLAEEAAAEKAAQEKAAQEEAARQAAEERAAESATTQGGQSAGSATNPAGASESRPSSGSNPTNESAGGSANTTPKPNPSTPATPTGTTKPSGGSSQGTTTPTSGGTSAQRSAVVAAAYDILGGSYVYGAYNPASRTFDCSGLTMYCFARAGVSLSHYSESQRGAIANFKPVSQLQRGDLVWKSGHVGVYVGGGMMIHASTPSKGIVLSSCGYMSGGGWPA